MIIRTGTCSWKYDSWRGLVYSNERGINYLKEYSQHFNSVEIDQWFWSLHSMTSVSLPKEKDVIDYTASVPADFRFTIKVPNSITLTHHYKKAGDKESSVAGVVPVSTPAFDALSATSAEAGMERRFSDSFSICVSLLEGCAREA